MTPEEVAAAIAYDPEAWKKELPMIEEWLAKFGDRLPSELTAQLEDAAVVAEARPQERARQR